MSENEVEDLYQGVVNRMMGAANKIERLEKENEELEKNNEDAIKSMLGTGIENRRLEKENEELKKQVESLQQGALHAENKMLKSDLNLQWEAILDVRARLSEL